MAIGALIIGMSKCGMPGLGILNIAIFQNLLMAKEATGFGLPLLIMGDICSMMFFRRHADWSQLWRLFPWTGAGVVLGYFALGSISDYQARLMIGIMLLVMLGLHFSKTLKKSKVAESADAKINPAMAPAFGMLAGFVSMVANAAGPVMILYLLAMRLPKMAFIGTSVVFFTCMNLFKAPFLAHLDLITWSSMSANLKLAPFVVLGCVLGNVYAKKISQKVFESFAFWLSVVAVLYMLWVAIF